MNTDKQAKDTANSGKGMPDRTPEPGRERPGRQDKPADASAEASLALPHERDQATDMTSGKRSPVVEQAGRDLKRGLQDTGKQPEMNEAYQKQK